MKVRELAKDMRINGFGTHADEMEAVMPGDYELLRIEKRAWEFRAGLVGVGDFNKSEMLDYYVEQFANECTRLGVSTAKDAEKGRTRDSGLTALCRREANAWREGLYYLADELPPVKRLRDDLAQLEKQEAGDDDNMG